MFTILTITVDKLDVANSLSLVSSCIFVSLKKESRSTSSFSSRIRVLRPSRSLGK